MLKHIKFRYGVAIEQEDLAAVTALYSRLSKEHNPKRSSVFTREQLVNFLMQAPSSGTDLRAKVVILFGVFCLGRMREIAELSWRNVANTTNGYSVCLRRCKTPASRALQKFIIPYRFATVDVSALVERYRADTGGEGRLWKQYNGGQWREQPVGKSTIAEAPRAAATFLGLPDPHTYTGHGLRATGATLLAESGCTELQLQAAGNWGSTNAAQVYIRSTVKAALERATGIAGETADTMADNNVQTHAPEHTTPTDKPHAHTHHYSFSGTFTNTHITIAPQELAPQARAPVAPQKDESDGEQ